LKKRVVIFGGGTGPLSALGLPEYGYETTVITSTVDDGGSSGVLRGIHDAIIPPGDIRSIISHSARSPLLQAKLEKRITDDYPLDSSVLRNLLPHYGDREYVSALTEILRAQGNQSILNRELDIDNLKGHPLGNLLLVALMLEFGNEEGIKKLCQMANTSVDVLPASQGPTGFCFVTESTDSEHGWVEHEGEKYLDNIQGHTEPIQSCHLSPSSRACEEAIGEIREADYIVISPTSLYANVISILLIPRFREALKDKKIVWLGNIMTECGQTGFSRLSYTGAGHVHLLFKYLWRYPDSVLVPKFNWSDLIEQFGPDVVTQVSDKYREAGSSVVQYREQDIKLGIHYVQKDDLLFLEPLAGNGGEKMVIRHRPDKVAKYLHEIFVYLDTIQ